MIEQSIFLTLKEESIYTYIYIYITNHYVYIYIYIYIYVYLMICYTLLLKCSILFINNTAIYTKIMKK